MCNGSWGRRYRGMEFVDGMDCNFLEIELPPNATGGGMVHHPPLKTWCFEARPESHLALEQICS